MTEPEKMPSFVDLEHDVRNVAAAIQSAVDVIRADTNLSSHEGWRILQPASFERFRSKS